MTDAWRADAESASWRSWFGLPVMLLVLHAVLAWLGRAPGILAGEDDSRYIALARSLRGGQYREIWSPDAPAHHMYPPGYSTLLAAWTAIGGEGFDWLVALQIVLAVATLALAFDAIRRVAPPVVALAAMLILAVNPHLLSSAGEVRSECALGFVITLAFWASVGLPRGGRQTAIILAAAIAAPMMRTAGIVLPAAVVADLFLARRYRDAALSALLFAATVGPLIAWTMSDPAPLAGTSYAADLVARDAGESLGRGFIGRIIRSASFYPAQAIPIILPVPTIAGTPIDNAIATLIIVVGMGAGMFALFGRARLGVLIVLATAGMLSLWPWRAVRFLEPLLPLIVLLLLVGVERATSLLNRRAEIAAIAAVTFIIACTGAARSATQISAVRGCERGGVLPDARCLTPQERAYFSAIRFVRDSLPRGSRIVTVKAASLFHYTDTPTLRASRLIVLDTVAFWNRLAELKADYVIIGEVHDSEWPGLGFRLQTRCERLRIAAQYAPTTYVLRILPPDSAMATGNACAEITRVVLEHQREGEEKRPRAQQK